MPVELITLDKVSEGKEASKNYANKYGNNVLLPFFEQLLSAGQERDA